MKSWRYHGGLRAFGTNPPYAVIAIIVGWISAIARNPPNRIASPIRKQFENGFSLLELLLVLLVLSASLVLGLEGMQRYQRQQMIWQSSASMQSILQAASQYYLNHGEWPTALPQLLVSDLVASDFCSPWEGETAKGSVCGNKTPYRFICPSGSCAKAKFFGVEVRLPNETLAANLANYLPTAQVAVGDPHYVRAYQPIPSVSSSVYTTQQQGFIATAGVYPAREDQRTHDDIYLPQCPEGFEGHYLTSFLHQHTGHQQDNGHYQQVYLHTEPPYLETPQWQLPERLQTIDNTKAKSAADVYIMTLCLPKGHWHPLSMLEDFMNHHVKHCVSDDTAGAMNQCSDDHAENQNWRLYNGAEGACSSENVS